MVKILAIGDPHGDLAKIKKISLKHVDLILLTGDLGNADLARKRSFENVEREKKGIPLLQETPEFNKRCLMQIYDSSMRVLKYLERFAPVYIIFGNVESHDYDTFLREKEMGLKLPRFVRSVNTLRNIEIINNRIRNFQGVRIGGLEYFTDEIWVRNFKPKDYKKNLEAAKKETQKMRRILNWFGKVNILVCHQPPYGFLDKVTAKFAPKHWQGKHAGSKAVLDYIKKYKPRYVFCGHIHEGEGLKKIGKTEVYNLGVCGWKIVEF